MPYINKEMQNKVTDTIGYSINNLDDTLKDKVDDLIDHIRINFKPDIREGVCNYTISRIVAGSLRPNDGWRYKWLNRAVGVFECAKQEFIRRVVNNYENNCIEKNGDIPEYENN